MVERAEKFVNCINYLAELGAKESCRKGHLKNMSSEDFEALKTACEVIDSFNELVMKEAVMLTEINRKLDLLLAKKES